MRNYAKTNKTWNFSFSHVYIHEEYEPQNKIFCFILKHLHAHDNKLETMQIVGESQIILHADTWRKPNHIAQV